MIKIDSPKNNVVRVGDPVRNHINIFTNFKAFVFADMLNKLSYVDVNEVTIIDEDMYGIAIKLKPGYMETLIETIPNLLSDYECQGTME